MRETRRRSSLPPPSGLTGDSPREPACVRARWSIFFHGPTLKSAILFFKTEREKREGKREGGERGIERGGRERGGERGERERKREEERGGRGRRERGGERECQGEREGERGGEREREFGQNEWK